MAHAYLGSEGTGGCDERMALAQPEQRGEKDEHAHGHSPPAICARAGGEP